MLVICLELPRRVHEETNIHIDGKTSRSSQEAKMHGPSQWCYNWVTSTTRRSGPFLLTDMAEARTIPPRSCHSRACKFLAMLERWFDGLGGWFGFLVPIVIVQYANNPSSSLKPTPNHQLTIGWSKGWQPWKVDAASFCLRLKISEGKVEREVSHQLFHQACSHLHNWTYSVNSEGLISADTAVDSSATHPQ